MKLTLEKKSKSIANNGQLHKYSNIFSPVGGRDENDQTVSLLNILSKNHERFIHEILNSYVNSFLLEFFLA